MTLGIIYCVNCGSENDSANIVCTNCGARLQKSIAPGGVAQTQPGIQQPSDTWWGRLNPAVKGAAIMFVAILVLRSIASVTRGLSCLFSFPFEIALAMTQGVLVSKYAAEQKPKYQPKDYPYQAALSAFYVYLPGLLFGVFLGLATGDLLLIPLLVLNFLQGIGGVLLYMLMASISAWIYVRTGGKGMVGILVGVGCLGMLVVSLILAVVAFLLISWGGQLWQQYFTLFQIFSV